MNYDRPTKRFKYAIYHIIYGDVKMNTKTIRFFMVSFIIIGFFLSIIHESGHVLFCFIVGGKTLSFGFKDEMLGIIYVENQYPNMTARGIGALGGSLFSCLITLILLLLFRKSKYSYGFIMILFLESAMWSLSIILQKGDAWNVSQALNINPFLILIPMIIMVILTYFIQLKIMFRTLDRMKGFE